MSSYDVIIIGGGPAGLTAGIYVTRARLKALLMEGLFPGGKMTNTSVIDNYPGIEAVNGTDLAGKMYAHSMRFGLEQEFSAVTGIRVLPDRTLEVLAGERVFPTKSVIVATGTVNRKLGIPGEEEYAGKGISYCAVCDGSFYKDKDVVVIGGGNSAFEDADYLTRFANKVTLVLRRDVARAEKYLQEVVERNPKIEVLHNLLPQTFSGDGLALTEVRFADRHTGAERTIACDGAFPMVGLVPETGFLKDLRILNEEGFVLTDERMATSVPGIYAAGDVRQTVLRQIVTAAADGAIAAQSVIAYLDLH